MSSGSRDALLPVGGWLMAAAAAVASFSPSALAPIAAGPSLGRAAGNLPAAFAKPLPDTIDDLRQIEDHVAALAEEVREATVAVRVGNAFGSGVVVSEDGYIMTAGHVSGRPNRRAEVVFEDGTKAAAVTLGQNISADSGMMKLVGGRTDWPAAPLAAADEVSRGDWCLVLGHPGGTKPGRPAVVRLGRVLFNGDDLLQTDCELVGGDSGGPLFDMHGRVIGINSRIAESADMNFHVPVASFLDEWEDLVAGREMVPHTGAFLGVWTDPDPRGVVVTEVEPGDPADFAGIQVGDVITRFQGRRIRNHDMLREAVGEEQPGARVRVQLFRDGSLMTLNVRLGSRDD